MNYFISPYIISVMDGNECVGQGFIADGYFITAAHVVRDNPECYIKYDGMYSKLSDSRPSFIGEGDSPDQIDVALYKFNPGNSPLHLNLHIPQMAEMFNSICVTPSYNSSTGTYYNRFSEEKALVLGEEEGNYFYCKCNRFSGSSGSPLLWENQVVGIMHGGDNKGLICAFLKIESFIFHTDIHVEYNKADVVRRLLPCGIDRTKAICILQAMHIDLSLMGINLAEEGIFENGYYAVLDRLPFDIHALTDEERKVLDEYCTYIIEST